MAVQSRRDFQIEPGVVEKVRLHSDVVRGFRDFRKRHFFGVPQTPRLIACEERMVKARNDAELLLEVDVWLQIMVS